MKQLCYLAPSEEEHRFDELFEALDIVPSYYDTGQLSSLTGFVLREKTVNRQDYIVCDLTETAWSQEHILSAAQQLRRFSVARLIFIAPASERTAALFGRLAAQRVDDLIAVEETTDLREELRRRLTRREEDGIHQRLSAMRGAMAAAAARTAAPLAIPAGMSLTVAVGGAMPRIGTTTQTFGLYHYLKSLGSSPCVYDPERTLLDVLLPFYRDRAAEQEDGVTAINGVSFASARTGGFNAYVRDIGVITEQTLGAFCAAELRVLVGGIKPWELPPLAAAVGTLKGAPGETVTLLSFAAAGELERVGKYLGRYSAAVPYTPDLWLPGSQSAYRDAVLPCLKALCAGGAT